MKKSLLLLSSAFFLMVGSVKAQYSNSSWSGPWIVTGAIENYVIFDGAGVITETGQAGAVGGQGTYSINSQGAITGTIVYNSSSYPCAGNLTNDSTASLLVTIIPNVMTIPLTFYRVTNAGQYAGTWDGSIVQTVGGSVTKNTSIVVDNNGNVTSATNLAATVTGKLFHARGITAGLIKTGESAPWNEIQLKGTTISNNISGTSYFGSTSNSGSYTLAKQTNVSVSVNESAKVRTYPNPVQDQFTIEGANGSTIFIYDILGNQISKNLLTANKSTLSVSSLGLSKGVYFYSVTGAAQTQGRFIVE